VDITAAIDVGEIGVGVGVGVGVAVTVGVGDEVTVGTGVGGGISSSTHPTKNIIATIATTAGKHKFISLLTASSYLSP